jgi:uncharacterized protein YukE
MISYVDTIGLEKISVELSDLANQLDEEFDDLFTRLKDVPNETKEWVGNQAKVYFQKVTEEQSKYKNLSNKLRALSSELLNEANELEGTISDNNKD